MSEKSPHKAILLVRLEVHDIIAKTGECSGNPVTNEKLKEYGLRPSETLTVDGQDMDDCLRKVRETIDRLR